MEYSHDLGQGFINISDSPLTLPTQLKESIKTPHFIPNICYYYIFPL